MLNFRNSKTEIIIVDDDPSELDAYRFLLESMGVQQITTLQDSRNVLGTLEKSRGSVLFLDLNMPHKSGREVLVEVRDKYPHTPVVICTANSDIEMAVACLKLGAHDYLVKPINMNTFGSALRNALEISSLRNEVMNLKGLSFAKELKNPHHFSDIITKNPAMFALFHYIESITASSEPVLILGETGSGKELVSKAIHNATQLRGEFVAVDLSGLDDTLFADTLFGHAKGAYTGADSNRSGLIEKAAGGTIFLDEIGDLSKVSQVKLLRLLQEGIYYPLGADTPKKCKARIITATNKELNKMAGMDGEFRMDLYYRLSTHLIVIPPLRERKEDIPLLVDYLKERAANSMGKKITSVSKELLNLLSAHQYPGNVRELKTYIYDAVAQCDSQELSEHHIKERLNQERHDLSQKKHDIKTILNSNSNGLEKIFGHFPTLEELTKYAINMALQNSNNNQSHAARRLGISKQALNKRLLRKQS
ncbi:MAG: sigma-54-dependent Fis family transcriptional regulator [Desulfamplus sp.]|nr:sigma-54-dependent Fis family transcriptional regulator [Desulfamplus sp.]